MRRSAWAERTGAPSCSASRAPRRSSSPKGSRPRSRCSPRALSFAPPPRSPPGGLGGYTAPEGTVRVLIARDGDAPGAAGAERLEARCRARGIPVAVLAPTHGDCNDELRAAGAASLGARIDTALSRLPGVPIVLPDRECAR